MGFEHNRRFEKRREGWILEYNRRYKTIKPIKINIMEYICIEILFLVIIYIFFKIFLLNYAFMEINDDSQKDTSIFFF